MQCPQCCARTEVCETRGPFRDRRCTNAACGLDFTTREQVMKRRERGRQCAKTRLTQIDLHPRSPAALAEVGANSCGTRSAPFDPGAGMRRVQEKQAGLQAEVAA